MFVKDQQEDSHMAITSSGKPGGSQKSFPVGGDAQKPRPGGQQKAPATGGKEIKPAPGGSQPARLKK